MCPILPRTPLDYSAAGDGGGQVVEEGAQLLVLAARVTAAERDELARIFTVEEEVGEEVGAAAALGLGHAAHEAAEHAAVALQERGRAHELGGELAEVLGGAHEHGLSADAARRLPGGGAHRLVDLRRGSRGRSGGSRLRGSC